MSFEILTMRHHDFQNPPWEIWLPRVRLSVSRPSRTNHCSHPTASFVIISLSLHLWPPKQSTIRTFLKSRMWAAGFAVVTLIESMEEPWRAQPRLVILLLSRSRVTIFCRCSWFRLMVWHLPGTSISVYGTVDSTSGGVVTSYALDGAPAAQVTSRAGSGDTYNQLFWASPTFAGGNQ